MKGSRIFLSNTNKMQRMKVLVTVIVILSTVFATIILKDVGTRASLLRSEGIVLDFGDYYTVWTDIDYKTESDNPLDMLEVALSQNQGSKETDDNGNIVSVTIKKIDIETSEEVTITKRNDESHSWGLWYIPNDGTEFVKAQDYAKKGQETKVIAWAYVEDGKKPTVAVDATGASVYGYSNQTRISTLSPVCTETLACIEWMAPSSVSITDNIVGTDIYSNFPKKIVEGHNSGKIRTVGTYENPSYESIMNTRSNLVICDGSVYAHVNMAGILRNSNVNAVVLYDGKDIQAVINDIFIVAAATGYQIYASELIKKMIIALDGITNLTKQTNGQRTLVQLSDDNSPYASGSGTYLDDIIKNYSNGINPVADICSGWANITSEEIRTMNPETIIIVDYSKSVSDYDSVLQSLSPEWKSTQAYKNGKIYLVCSDLSEMQQRAGPRIAQVTELFARIINPDAFSDGITEIPKALSIDNYSEYLKYTKSLGWN